MNCFRWNGFHFQNKLPDPQSANEKAIARDNLILPSRLALLGPTPGKGSSAAYKLPASVLTPAAAPASWLTHLLWHLCDGEKRRRRLDRRGHDRGMCLRVTGMYSFATPSGCVTHNLWDIILWAAFKAMLIAGSVEVVKWDVASLGGW